LYAIPLYAPSTPTTDEDSLRSVTAGSVVSLLIMEIQACSYCCCCWDAIGYGDIDDCL